MRFVDVFSFAEPHEADQLWVKMNLGQAGITEWVIVENEYTLRGERKGYHFPAVFYGEDRFEPFRDRVKYIQCSIAMARAPNHTSVYDQYPREVEYQQRECAKNYLLSEYSDEDVVFLSDCDECVDFSIPDRRDVLLKHLRSCSQFLRVPRTRFWYDYDNLWSESRSIPAVRIGYLRDSGHRLSEVRFERCGIGPAPPWKKKVVFEYSFCFRPEDILRKYGTFMHTGYTREEIIKGITCNHLAVSSARGQVLTLEPRWWLETVELTPSNSPSFVRKHLDELKTHTVPVDYRERRRQEYPELFSLRNRTLWELKKALQQCKKKTRRLRRFAPRAARELAGRLGIVDK